MVVVEIVVAAVVVFGVAAIAMGYGGSITHFRPDWPGSPLPSDRTLRSNDVSSVRFSLALRGYRMDEVDTALDRLAAEIAERDARIEQLTGRRYEAGDLQAAANGSNDGAADRPAAGEDAPRPGETAEL